MSPAEHAPRSSLAPEAPQRPEVDGLDPELVQLVAPPRGERTLALVVMAAAVFAALGVLATLWTDLAYSLVRGPAVDLGTAQSLRPSELKPNTYVRLRGIPTLAHATHFARGLGQRFTVFPLAGQRLVYVQVEQDSGFGRADFSGRLATFGDLGGRYEDVASYLASEQGLPVTSQSFVLLSDEPPSAYRWTWIVAFFCIAFVALDVWFVVRWFKPLRA